MNIVKGCKMQNEELKNITKKFAHRCAKLALELPNRQLGKHISGQLIRCSTSVAANYRASCIAQFKESFISKLTIVPDDTKQYRNDQHMVFKRNYPFQRSYPYTSLVDTDTKVGPLRKNPVGLFIDVYI
jgi:four helix bundle protein